MFYEIDNKPYIKVGGRYTEIIVKLSPNNKIIFVPTNNNLSIRDVGRNYSIIDVATLRDKFIEN